MADEKENKEEFKHINIKVVGQDKSSIMFKVLRSAPLKKLMTVYCDRLNFNIRELRFLYDGSRIQDNDTPTSLEMEDDPAEIDVVKEADGGACA
ncbi:unnamed protein product [Chironomus riparius]|uniref:Small ubiquitin-related modifier n=1 Tax=Chironomus riparius TaxID=315576 RepID=A0A9N9WPF7_9DIPT|nr:unnamed protein product [Chironomus riparius]